MSTPTESPIFEFLMRKDNLPQVLEVLRHGPTIRKTIADCFWKDLEASFMKSKPDDLGAIPSWKKYFGRKDRKLREVFAGLEEDVWLGLDVVLGSEFEESQGLNYRIEVYHKYCGFGLAWRKETQNFKNLCRLPPVQDLRSCLEQVRLNGLELENEPNQYWLYWAYWDRDTYRDLWAWFEQSREFAWFETRASPFWYLVKQTHALVVEANKVLRKA
jgi:hypothetical protein